MKPKPQLTLDRIPDSTFQASTSATDSAFQASNRKFLRCKGVFNMAEAKRLSVFQPEFEEDLKFWKKTDPQKLERIRKLITAILEDPFKGLGKPERLKYFGPNAFSRRIDKKHRLVYVVFDDTISFVQARFHYD
jgi:toxin YoeB